MRVADDDGSEWSFEIFDGDCVNDAPTKSIKQTPPTTSRTGAANKSHPFFLNDFSTKVTVAGTHLTGQETVTRRPADALSGTLSPKLGGVPTLMANYAEAEVPQPKSCPIIPAHESALPNNDRRERAPFKRTYDFPRFPPPTPLTRDTSSSSTQNSLSNVDGGLTLPVYSFMEYDNPPAVVYSKSESEANNLVQTLNGPLGFDLEWRVMWHPGAQERRTALVQLCDHHTILLIQVSSMKRFPSKVLEIIESASTVKTGANILNDGEKLYRDFGIRAKGLVELGAFATKADDKFNSVYNREIVSLAKMVAMYLGRTLLKGKVRTSNWEADLSDDMIEYAANDCHCALMVYDRLQEIARRDGKTLDVSTYSRQVTPHAPKLSHHVPLPTPLQNVKPSTGLPLPHYCIPEPPRPQQLRAYKLWHVDRMPLDQMCMKLRTGARIEPLKASTVISYVVGALQADPRLPFDMRDLKALVHAEASGWQRHRQWIISRERLR